MWKHHSYDEKKLMFYELDQRVMNIPDEDISTIPDFIEKLTSWIPNDNTHKEIYLVRGFTIWLRHVTGRKLAGEQPTVPNEILDFFEDNYTMNMIEIFCRNAGIETEIVEGITKGAAYRAGDIVDDSNLLMKYKSVWLAFRCNKQWHLVDGFDVISGHQEGDEILLEEGGQRLVKRREAAIGTSGTSEGELWFCPDPVLASYYKLPDDEQWQLLPDDRKVKSVNEFFDLPHCHDFFFECQVRLISERTCRLTSKNGKNVIRLMVGGPKSVTTRFTYSLSLIGGGSDLPDLSALPLLVCQTRDQDVVTFEIRYPMVGIYHFVIDVKKPGTSYFLNAISFHLTCAEVDIKLKTLPINTGPSGFGYNDSAEDTGLTRPSTSKAKLVVKPSDDGQERQKITFDLDEDIANQKEYVSTIYTSVMADDGTYTTTESQELTRVEKNEVDGKLVIDVGLKTGGEHCLAIGSRKKDTNDAFLLFMYYLVTSKEDSEDEQVLAEVKRQKRGLRSTEKLSKKKKIKSEYEIELEALASEIEELKEQYGGIDTKDIEVKTDLIEREAQTDTVQSVDAETDTGGCVHIVDKGAQTDVDTMEQNTQTENKRIVMETVETQTDNETDKVPPKSSV